MPEEREEIIVGGEEVTTSDPLSQLKKAERLFFIFIAIGFLIILVPNFSNISHLFGIPASIAVLIYWRMAINRKSDFQETEVVADAVYYLGFLYTFFALLIGFFSSIGDVAALNIIELIGVALTTTVVGLSIRIYLIHFKKLDTGEEQEIRQSVAQSMALLNQEINSSINQIRDLRQNSVTQLTTTIDDVQNSISGSLQGFQENLQDQLGEVRHSITEQMNANLNNQIENLNEIAQQSVQNLADVTEGLVARINDIDIPQDLLTNNFNQALENFYTQSHELGEHVSEVNRLMNAERESIVQINNQLETLSTNFNQIELDFEPLRQVGNIANNLNASLTQLNSRLNTLDDAFVNNATQFANNVGEASSSFLEARDSVRNMSAEIQQTIDGLNTYIEDLMRD